MTEELRPLSAELRQVAETELNEVVERLPADLDALRDWLSKQPHLKARQDSQFLVAFLRGCKFSLEKTKSKLDHFYTIKTLIPELFANRGMDDKNIALCRTGTYIRLPKPLGPGGPRIQLTNYSKFDPKAFKIMDLFRYQTMVMEQRILHDDNCNKMGVFSEKAQPTRIKGVHLVNCPKEAVAVLNLAKGLMPSKLQKRFHVYKNVEDLYKVIPQEYLPEEYGGTNGRIEDITADIEKEMLAFNDYFKQDEQYGVNEKLRPGKRVNSDTLFGIEGSFRKLDID
ncbi:alpha-tocopherol transfer protein-like isoform X2 [Drosophila tropicalis]|uniref:alpha-tocopherol transfer protein-like isoform X2 n=1 Tax=Drosophila tropicalis TaxID=46794 RepID=UPI0035AB96DB